LGIKNTADEHEALHAPFRGNMGFLRKGRYFLIKAMRGERQGKQTAYRP
jgi:hypothetical protein